MSPHHVGSFWSAFVSAFSLITTVELGDKSFLITSILAVQKSRSAVFFGSLTAMSVMNALSLCLGVLTVNIPQWIIHRVSICLFLFFGIKMLAEGLRMSEADSEQELQEAQKFLTENKNNKQMPNDSSRLWLLVFVEVFSIVFFAEWGDRSQLSTILLATQEDTIWAVGLGAFVGYLLCSSLAVAGSRIVLKIISLKAVTMLGGLVFVVCALANFNLNTLYNEA